MYRRMSSSLYFLFFGVLQNRQNCCSHQNEKNKLTKKIYVLDVNRNEWMLCLIKCQAPVCPYFCKHWYTHAPTNIYIISCSPCAMWQLAALFDAFDNWTVPIPMTNNYLLRSYIVFISLHNCVCFSVVLVVVYFIAKILACIQHRFHHLWIILRLTTSIEF